MTTDVSIGPVPPRHVLEGWWRDLESRSDPTFFTTWSWIGCWLDVLPSSLATRLITARKAGQVVGLGILVQGKSLLLRSIPVSSWRLHATGMGDFDSLSIEYNGFLADRQDAPSVRQAMLEFMLFKGGVKRFEIAKAEHSFLSLSPQARSKLLVRSQDFVSYVVDLNKVSLTGEGGYLSLLSANTRSQVRRSLSGYRQLGAVTVEQADSQAQAREYLSSLRALHTANWDRKGEQTAFASSAAAHRFHDQLIEQSFERGEVQLLRVTVGDRVLGYLYNFIHRGHLIYYQSGFQYGLLDKQDRPGLVCHALAVEWNAKAGLSRYDFASGDYRYKTSLATDCETQRAHVVQHKSLLARLDESLRVGKRALRAYRDRQRAVAMTLLTMLMPPEVLDNLCASASWLTV